MNMTFRSIAVAFLTLAVLSASVVVSSAVSKNHGPSISQAEATQLIRRHLEQQNNNNNGDDYYEYDLSEFSVRFDRCQYVQMYDDNQAQEGNGYPFSVRHFAVYRLCPSDNCMDCDSSDVYGRYVSELEDYLDYTVNEQITKLEYLCQNYCNQDCDDDANCNQDNCPNVCIQLQNMEANGYIDASNFIQCQELNIEEYVDDNVQDDAVDDGDDAEGNEEGQQQDEQNDDNNNEDNQKEDENNDNNNNNNNKNEENQNDNDQEQNAENEQDANDEDGADNNNNNQDQDQENDQGQQQENDQNNGNEEQNQDNDAEENNDQDNADEQENGDQNNNDENNNNNNNYENNDQGEDQQQDGNEGNGENANDNGDENGGNRRQRRRRKLEDGNQQKLYIGPSCSSDGGSVVIGLFSDQYCMQPYTNSTPEDLFGRSLSYIYMNHTSSNDGSECLSCMESEDDANAADEADGDEVNEMCEELYDTSAKCESKYGLYGFINQNQEEGNYENQVANEYMACNFVESLLADSYTETGEINLNGGAYLVTREMTQVQMFVVSVMSVVLVALLGTVYCLRKQVDQIAPKVDLASQNNDAQYA